ncbi:MAG: dUTP diphosphatase [Alphaproteobacteria bacterium]|nr:dUTP diphosphatase [Alphaproteobacteria bacterium]
MNQPVVRVLIERLPHAEGLPLPDYATSGSAGADLAAAVDGEVALPAGERRLIPTGFRLALPPGYEAQIRPRSGLAWKAGVTVLNAPGTIDADYRGEVSVLLVNLGRETLVIRRGDRIAQMVVAPVCRVSWQVAAPLPASDRGEGGFGSSGVASATETNG